MEFQGIYVHDGNSYTSKGTEKLHESGNETADKMLQVREL